MRFDLGLRHRLAWVTEPWARASVYVPMVLAFTVPALFLAAGHRFERAAADSVTAQVVERAPQAERGLTVVTNGRLRADLVASVDQRVSDRLEEVRDLGAVTTSLYTARGSSAALSDASTESVSIPAAPRFFSRDGAIESLVLLDHTSDFAGVYVSEDYARRGELGVGSSIRVTIEGVDTTVRVQAIYEDLWPEPPDYWNSLPPELVPTYSQFFLRPTFEALIADDGLVADLNMPGFIRWDAPAEPPPNTLEALEAAVDEFAAVEEALVRDPELVDALQAFAGVAGATPSITSSFADALTETRSALRSLERPLAASQAAGLVLGLVIVAANSSFLALRRRRVWRVLVSGGDGPLRLLGLAMSEAAVPAVLGAVIGVAGSSIVTSRLVPGGGAGLDAVRAQPIIAFTVLALLIAASVTTAIATGLGDQQRTAAPRLPAWLILPVIAVAIAGWIQAGDQTFRGTISPIVIFAPIAVLAAAAGLAMVGLRWLLNATSRTALAQRLPVLLGVRRIAASSLTGAILAGALAVSIGLSVYALSTNQTRSQSIEAKSATLVGSQSSATLVDLFPPGATPAGLSVVAISDVSISPGGARVQVIAIDPATFGDVVAWPEEFGSLQPSEVVDRLQRRDGSDIPAIALASRPVLDEGAFGIGETFPYRVVDTVDSAPLVGGSRPILLIRADVLEAAATDRFVTNFTREFGRPPTAADTDELHSSPLDGFRHKVIADLPASELEQVTVANEVLAWDFADRSDVAETPAEQAAEWSFTFLQFVGYTCLLVSLLATVLYARERRAARVQSDRVGRTIGIDRRTAVWAGVVEFGLLGIVALVPGVVAAVAVSARIAPTFERFGQFPPEIELAVPIGAVALLAGAAFLCVVTIGAVVEGASRGGSRGA